MPDWNTTQKVVDTKAQALTLQFYQAFQPVSRSVRKALDKGKHTLLTTTMPKNKKPDNPDKPDIIVYIGGELYQVELAPGVDANKVAAKIDTVLRPERKTNS